MFLVDYKPSLQRKMDREEGREEGYRDGLIAGENIGFTKGEIETQTQIVKNMIARGMQDEEIIDLTGCSQELIDQLRNK